MFARLRFLSVETVRVALLNVAAIGACLLIWLFVRVFAGEGTRISNMDTFPDDIGKMVDPFFGLIFAIVVSFFVPKSFPAIEWKEQWRLLRKGGQPLYPWFIVGCIVGMASIFVSRLTNVGRGINVPNNWIDSVQVLSAVCMPFAEAYLYEGYFYGKSEQNGISWRFLFLWFLAFQLIYQFSFMPLHHALLNSVQGAVFLFAVIYSRYRTGAIFPSVLIRYGALGATTLVHL